MDSLRIQISEDIVDNLLNRLQEDDLFPADLVQQVGDLFESGDIAVQTRVMHILIGDSSENTEFGG